MLLMFARLWKLATLLCLKYSGNADVIQMSSTNMPKPRHNASCRTGCTLEPISKAADCLIKVILMSSCVNEQLEIQRGTICSLSFAREAADAFAWEIAHDASEACIHMHMLLKLLVSVQLAVCMLVLMGGVHCANVCMCLVMHTVENNPLSPAVQHLLWHHFHGSTKQPSWCCRPADGTHHAMQVGNAQLLHR